MAVYAAHLTRTVSGEPSVFQVAAQEALGATVKPALRKLVEYLAAVYPDKCGWTVVWYDELYLLFDCCLQYHYLKHYAASFSESFYGLIRVPLHISNEFSSGVRLPEWAERGSLVLLVLLPYLRDKAEAITQRWRERMEDGVFDKGTKSDRARAAAVQLYAIVHLVSEGARLYYLAAWLSGRVRSPTPSLASLKLVLRPAPPREPAHSWTDLAKSLVTGNLGSAMVSFPMVGSLALRGAEYGAFLVQLLRWWDSRAPAHAALPPPPPPQRAEYSTGGARARWRNRCPMCLEAWRVPTAAPASGLVFCYACISKHVRARQTCPATGLPVHERQLVRLYIDQ